MNKSLLYIIAGLVILTGGFFLFGGENQTALSAKDATYIIDGKPVKLANGFAEEAIPGSAAKITTRYFGNEAYYDFDLDGREDVVFLLTQETGGSGVFYYVVAALNKENGYIGSYGLLLGDRIAPQTTENGKGKIIIVNYADRAKGESFAAKPSVGKSIWLLLDVKTMQFGEVAQNFEGEANPAMMKLDMKKWTWISASFNDGRTIYPKKTNAFNLQFLPDGVFSASTDCNGVGGEYSASGGKISFTRMMSTLMYCEGSQEGEFAKLLADSSGYHFTSRGELILDLKFDSGTVTFR